MGEQDSKQNSTSADRSVKNRASREKPAEATKPLFIDMTEESGAFNARNKNRARPPSGIGARQIGRLMRFWEHSFRPDLKLEDLPVGRQSMEFLYSDADQCVFMNPETYDWKRRISEQILRRFSP